MIDSIPDEYDEFTVPDVRGHVAEIDDDSVLADLVEYEREHKNRKTALEAINDRRSTLSPTGDDDPDEVVVTTTDAYIGMVAGLHFDRRYEHKRTAYTTRVKRAIENGELRRVDI